MISVLCLSAHSVDSFGGSCGRGAHCPRIARTYSGLRCCEVNHITVFSQLRGIIVHEGVNTVKPSAQPTLVRTQHLPPPAETARALHICGVAGRFLLVPRSE